MIDPHYDTVLLSSCCAEFFIQLKHASDIPMQRFIRILSIYTKLYGSNDGRVGMAMCSLAHALCAKGNLLLLTQQ